MTEKRRLQAPWSIEQTPSGYKVRTANGIDLCYVYAEPPRPGDAYGNWKRLDPDEGRRVAKAIARLPELLKPSAPAARRPAERSRGDRRRR